MLDAQLSDVSQVNPMEIKMRRIIVAVCCAALVGSVSIASAQTTGPNVQQNMQSGGSMNSNARMMKNKKGMKSGMTKSSGQMNKGGMGSGMKKGM